ncbi:MAG: preprotein translocase subunit SecG [Chitinophagales bacterium]
MFTLIVIIALVICVALGLFILIQNPKGGGLSGSFGGAANQLFGYSRSADGIEKWTWYMICAVFVLCLASAAFKPADSTPTLNIPGAESQGPSTGTQDIPTLDEVPVEDPGTTTTDPTDPSK